MRCAAGKSPADSAALKSLYQLGTKFVGEDRDAPIEDEPSRVLALRSPALFGDLLPSIPAAPTEERSGIGPVATLALSVGTVLSWRSMTGRAPSWKINRRSGCNRSAP